MLRRDEMRIWDLDRPGARAFAEDELLLIDALVMRDREIPRSCGRFVILRVENGQARHYQVEDVPALETEIRAFQFAITKRGVLHAPVDGFALPDAEEAIREMCAH